MVVQFANDHHHLSEIDAQHLITKVRDGDLSVVLKAYENEIKHPLKNAITGTKKKKGKCINDKKQ